MEDRKIDGSVRKIIFLSSIFFCPKKPVLAFDERGYDRVMSKREPSPPMNAIAGAACTLVAFLGILFGILFATANALGWLSGKMGEIVMGIFVGFIGLMISAIGFWLGIRWLNRRDDPQCSRPPIEPQVLGPESDSPRRGPP